VKILHVANFAFNRHGALFYAMDRKISNGLIRNGHQVYDFSYRDMARFSGWFNSTKTGRRKMAAAFLETVRQFQPQLLFLGHSELLTADDLLAARSLCPEVKVAMYWVDPLDRIAHLRERVGILDVLFATTGIVPLARALGDRKTTTLSFFPNITDTSIETGQAFSVEHFLHDLVFIGRVAPERQVLAQMLATLSKTLDVGIYGNSKTTQVFGAKYIDLLSSSRMGINYSRYNDIAYYTSDRMAQLTGNGVLTFTPPVPGMTDLFTSDEVVYFDDWADLSEKVHVFHRNIEACRCHARRGGEKAHRAFNENRVTRFMMETIFDTGYSEPYEWQNQVLR